MTSWGEPTQATTIRQCAWCWLIVDNTGEYRIRSSRKMRSATHGICPTCKKLVQAKIEGGSTAPLRAAA